MMMKRKKHTYVRRLLSESKNKKVKIDVFLMKTACESPLESSLEEKIQMFLLKSI